MQWRVNIEIWVAADLLFLLIVKVMTVGESTTHGVLKKKKSGPGGTIIIIIIIWIKFYIWWWRRRKFLREMTDNVKTDLFFFMLMRNLRYVSHIAVFIHGKIRWVDRNVRLSNYFITYISSAVLKPARRIARGRITNWLQTSNFYNECRATFEKKKKKRIKTMPCIFFLLSQIPLKWQNKFNV